MGSPLPFDEVYRLYADRVYRFCLSMVREPALAEDLGSEVFLAALGAYERAQPDPDGVQLWLFRIAKHKVLMHFRSTRRFQRAVQRVLRRDEVRTGSVEADVILSSDVTAALDAVARLSRRDRMLIAMRVAEVPYAEVSTLLDITERAATVATNRAIEKLRRNRERDAP